MTKILVSAGFGAGWSTWSDKPKQVAEYKPIIEYIENGGDPNKLTVDHPLVKQMCKDLDLNYFYAGGNDGLYVAEVDGPYRINERDGCEIVRQTQVDFW